MIVLSRIILREYQEKAVQSFEQNNRTGIFEMATGTGKTLTALYCAQKYFAEKQQQFLVIIVPYLHLISQWMDDFPIADINNFLEISGNKKDWLPKLDKQIWSYNRGFRKQVVLIGSYKSMASDDFQKRMKMVEKGQFLIADECHYIGSASYYQNNFGAFDAKLGLSATPKRWWDEEGTNFIFSLFEKTVYEYSMEDAIAKQYLTPYYYYPQRVELSEEEIENYTKLTKKITQLFLNKNRSYEEQEQLDRLLLKRSRIIQNAENKISQLLLLLQKQKDRRFTLVYCGVGQIDKTVQAISELGIRTHRFNSEIHPNGRKKILKDFAAGEIEVLVAIKCLDEGVDVPATKIAYFLASTSNPREFVQRRGRILRKSINKQCSLIYDFVVLPSEVEHVIFKNIAQKEMPRFAEFSSKAMNEFQARNQIRELLVSYDLESYLDILPWEMYEKLKQDSEVIL